MKEKENVKLEEIIELGIATHYTTEKMKIGGSRQSSVFNTTQVLANHVNF